MFPCLITIWHTDKWPVCVDSINQKIQCPRICHGRAVTLIRQTYGKHVCQINKLWEQYNIILLAPYTMHHYWHKQTGGLCLILVKWPQQKLCPIRAVCSCIVMLTDHTLQHSFVWVAGDTWGAANSIIILIIMWKWFLHECSWLKPLDLYCHNF